MGGRPSSGKESIVRYFYPEKVQQHVSETPDRYDMSVSPMACGLQEIQERMGLAQGDFSVLPCQ